MGSIRKRVPKGYKSPNIEDRRFEKPPRQSTVSQVMTDTIRGVNEMQAPAARKSKLLLQATKAIVAAGRRRIR